MLYVEISTENDAFREDKAAEIARILRELADKVQSQPNEGGVLRDINGNPIGMWLLRSER